MALPGDIFGVTSGGLALGGLNPGKLLSTPPCTGQYSPKTKSYTAQTVNSAALENIKNKVLYQKSKRQLVDN